jgi:hypothetical protein
VSPVAALLGALTQPQGQGHTVTATGRLVGTLVLAVAGAASVVVGRVGWRHAGALVPSSLPEDLHEKRSRVLRRGAVAFSGLGVLLLILAMWVVASS